MITDHAAFGAERGLAVGYLPQDRGHVRAVQFRNIADEMVVAGGSGTSAPHVGLFRNQSFCAVGGGINRGHKPGNTAADHQNVRIYGFCYAHGYSPCIQSAA